MTLGYTKRNGKTVNVTAVPHAISRFSERYMLLTGKKLSTGELLGAFCSLFNSSSLVTNLGKHERTRLKRYSSMGKTLFFRNSGFTFVVADAKIWTVEISDKNKRHLN